MQNPITTEFPDLRGLNACHVWETEAAILHLQAAGNPCSREFAKLTLAQLGILPAAINPESLHDETGDRANKIVLDWVLNQAHLKQKTVLFAQLFPLPDGTDCLHAGDESGNCYWLPLGVNKHSTDTAMAERGLLEIQSYIGKDIVLIPHGRLVGLLRNTGTLEGLSVPIFVYPPKLHLPSFSTTRSAPPPHLARLEAESIHILREAVAESENPVMMYSVGKDSSVMLHLAIKAFFPAPPPFPLLHIDTRWKFKEMYLFRDHMTRVSGMELLVHTNPDAIAGDINPFDHGSALHTDICKTEALKQALDKHQFDIIFGGARRDEEKSRAKERIFSFRSSTHRWDPKQQRPELWNLYNTRKNKGESIRVFPLSNWTELDVWQYICHENIPVVPLYFAKKRPVVVRDGLVLMIDDERFRLLPDDEISEKVVRFRTLGCYPLTGAIESAAATPQEIILELIKLPCSERHGRAIDSDTSSSMEKKKQAGYF